ncbi:hypothetical protein Q7P35_004521 [Cladosporium inversicolor]
MDPAASAVGIAALGIQTCQGLLFLLDSWRGDVSVFVPDSWKTKTSILNRVYDTVADLNKVLTLVSNSLQSRYDLNDEDAQSVGACLFGCKAAFLRLSNTLGDLRKHHAQESANNFPMRHSKAMFLITAAEKLQDDVLLIRLCLEPALYA